MIISLHSLKQKCQNCITLSMNVLNDLKDYQNLNQNAQNLIKKIDNFIDEILGEWNSSYMGIKDEIPRVRYFSYGYVQTITDTGQKPYRFHSLGQYKEGGMVYSGSTTPNKRTVGISTHTSSGNTKADSR